MGRKPSNVNLDYFDFFRKRINSLEGLDGKAENQQEIQDLGALQQAREYILYNLWEISLPRKKNIFKHAFFVNI